MRAKLSACEACVPCEKLSRNTFDARLDERVEHFATRARRADGGDDLGVAHGFTGFGVGFRSGSSADLSRRSDIRVPYSSSLEADRA